MSLILPKGLPAAAVLQTEGAPVVETFSAGVCPLHVGLLNLMPLKERTELDFARVLSAGQQDVRLALLKLPGQTYHHTPQEHMDAFYADLDPAGSSLALDGLVVTGAPVEQMPFEEVRYWELLCGVMDWARAQVPSTLYICWGAQAALYHFYGVPKYPLPAKRFGIFQQDVRRPLHPLLAGLSSGFAMPHSRHTEVRQADIDRHAALRTLVSGRESGVGIVATAGSHEVFVTGHLEYAPDTLHKEYVRDLEAGKPIQPPSHYYVDNRPEAGIDYSWAESARTFYRNWLDVCAGIVADR